MNFINLLVLQTVNQMSLRSFRIMAAKQLPRDFENTILRHIKLLQIIGMDIFDERDCGLLKKYGKFMFFTIAFLNLVVFELLFIEKGATFEDLADAVPCALIFVQDVTLLFVIAYRRNEIRELIFGIAEVWPNENSMVQEKRDILRTWLSRLKLFDNFYFTEALIGAVYFLTFPLFFTLYIRIWSQQEVYHFPFNMYFPVKVDSMASYLLRYAFQLIFGFVLHVCTHIPSILLLAAITVDISALMRLLQYDLENIFQERSITQRGSADAGQLYSLVKTHQKLLSLTEKVNKIFGPLVLVPVCLSSIILCFFGFLTTIADRVNVMKNFIGVIGIQFEIFNLSWPGQILADTSSGIAGAAYASLWYTSDPNSRKNIMTIIARSQKPCYISSLGYTNMTLRTFAKILSSSWSYLSLLRKVYQRDGA